MPSKISSIEAAARLRLNEVTARFWSSAELVDIIAAGARDLWRPIVDLKQEYYLKVNSTDVSLPANTSTLQGVPNDVHKVYLIEPADTSENSSNESLIFLPLDYNHDTFKAARSRADIEPNNDTIYYAITGQGAPVNAPTIYCAPQVNSAVTLSFSYVPTLGALTSDSTVPIPGEADNALIAWCVAFAMAKEVDGRAPSAEWLSIYATEKQNLLESLGLRQFQEPEYVDGLFASYW